MTASNGCPTTQRGDLSAVSGCESDNQSPANNSDVNCVDPYGSTVNQKSYSQLPTPLVCVQAEKHLESSSENKVTHVVAMPAHQPSKFPRADSGKPLVCSPWMIPRLVPTSFALDQPVRARDVESLLKELRYKKVREYSLPNFIPLRAKATLRDSNDNSFPLLDKVNNFLESKNEVFLILGDAGSGKTSFCKHLDYILWNSYKPGGMIPVHIDLHTIYRPEHDLIKKQLRADGFSNVKIQEMLHNRRFLLICDGYDECGITTNLHTTNKLNRTGQRNVKMVISCRTTLFSRGYQGLFHPHGADKYHDTSSDLFEEATIVPFTEDDVKAYIHQYICGTAMQDLADDRPRWTVEKFMDTFSTITGLSGLVKNPFVLWLALRVLPSLMSDALASTAKNGTTRAQLLDRFFENWVGVNKSRIQRRTKLKPKVFTVFQDLCDSEGGFKGCVTDFLTNLSAAMFEHQGYSPVVKYEHVKEEITWKGEFFGRTIKSTLLRDASPLNRAGDQYRFIHDTFFDYFRSLAFYTPDQGEDDGSDDGEDNDSDDSQGDDTNSSEGDETDDGDEEDSDSSEMDDSGEGAGDNEGDGGGILGPSDFFFIGLTGEVVEPRAESTARLVETAVHLVGTEIRLAETVARHTVAMDLPMGTATGLVETAMQLMANEDLMAFSVDLLEEAAVLVEMTTTLMEARMAPRRTGTALVRARMVPVPKKRVAQPNPVRPHLATHSPGRMFSRTRMYWNYWWTASIRTLALKSASLSTSSSPSCRLFPVWPRLIL